MKGGRTVGVFVEYPLDHCPKCGHYLCHPDDNFDRQCPACLITVKAATLAFEWVES